LSSRICAVLEKDCTEVTIGQSNRFHNHGAAVANVDSQPLENAGGIWDHVDSCASLVGGCRCFEQLNNVRSGKMTFLWAKYANLDIVALPT
jgi:hypothetical protein